MEILLENAYYTAVAKLSMSRMNEYDAVSDDLIDIIVDPKYSSSERNRACKDLVDRHTSWVDHQISQSIFNPDDIRDIAQSVWMIVLRPENLGSKYTGRHGKFRAYLRAPIRWSVLKHIDKLPFSVDDAGNKVALRQSEVTEAMQQQGIDKFMLDTIIEDIVKPSLTELEITSRNIYVLNEYPVIYEIGPDLAEVAEINGIGITRARTLLEAAKTKTPAECSEDELSMYIPIEYRNFIDVDELGKSSGRYLAGTIGVTEAVFRKKLHTARKYLIEIVRERFHSLEGE